MLCFSRFLVIFARFSQIFSQFWPNWAFLLNFSRFLTIFFKNLKKYIFFTWGFWLFPTISCLKNQLFWPSSPLLRILDLKKIRYPPILIRSRYCAFKSTFKVVLYVFLSVPDIADLNPYYGIRKLRLVPTVRKAWAGPLL